VHIRGIEIQERGAKRLEGLFARRAGVELKEKALGAIDASSRTSAIFSRSAGRRSRRSRLSAGTATLPVLISAATCG
jgi:hypothetical protein